WAPLGEEVAFRGVLYAALRSRFGVMPAAALSAAVFALAHGYGGLGVVAVFWSGALWALSYEKTGSLWPSIIAHCLGNLMATAGVMALLRLWAWIERRRAAMPASPTSVSCSPLPPLTP